MHLVPVKRASTYFLQTVIVLVGFAAVAFLLWEPQVEGRNVNATQFEIYFKDPFLAFAYVGSLPFFVALRHGFRLLGLVRSDRVFSGEAVGMLRIIKYCGVCLICFVAVGEVWILLNESDDRAGGVAMGVFVTFGSTLVVAAAAVLERLLQNAVDLKSENDLTV